MERKEPTMSGSIKPETDEVAARQGRATAAPGPRDPRRPEPPTTPPSGQPPESGGGNGLAIAALVVAVVSLGGSAFLGWKWMAAEDNLTQANDRIQNLERRLDVTSDQSSEYVEEIQEKLQWADSEIRKLWGVSYDTNRKRIAQNQEGIEALKRDLGTVKQTADSADGKLDSVQAALTETERKVNAMDSSLKEVQQATGTLADQQQRLQNLVEDVDQLERQLSALDGLAQRVGRNEEAIDAIDSYRRSINRELLEIKEQLSPNR